jgi:hypothetical protein
MYSTAMHVDMYKTKDWALEREMTILDLLVVRIYVS